MSDVPSSSQKIQVEGLTTRSAVSEAAIQSIAGAVNYLLGQVTPIGSVVSSLLTESQFQSVTTTGWVLADGRGVSGSAYHLLTGSSSIPDLRGIYLRGKNNGRSESTGNYAGEKSLGEFEFDKISDHSHGANRTFLHHTGGNGGDVEVEGGSELLRQNGNSGSIDAMSGAGNSTIKTLEVAPRSVTVNFFIRIN